MKEEKCCGNCCWFFAECTDGDGCCAKHYWFVPDKEGGKDPSLTRCDNDACKDYVSKEEKRHHLSTLILLSRWMKDKDSRHPVSWEDIMKAIEFAIDYIKTFNKL